MVWLVTIKENTVVTNARELGETLEAANSVDATDNTAEVNGYIGSSVFCILIIHVIFSFKE